MFPQQELIYPNFQFYSSDDGSIEPNTDTIRYFGSGDGDIGMDAQNKLIWAGWNGAFGDSSRYNVIMRGDDNAGWEPGIYAKSYYVWSDEKNTWVEFASSGGLSGGATAGPSDVSDLNLHTNTKVPWDVVYWGTSDSGQEGWRKAKMYFLNGAYMGYRDEQDVDLGAGGSGVSEEWNALLYLGGSPGSYNLYANHFIFTDGSLSSYEDNGGSVLDGNFATDAVASAVARYL